MLIVYTNRGSSAVSPSGLILVTSNLTTGLEWYSLQTRSLQMITSGDLGFKTRNYILDLQFIDETTVAVGDNLGRVAIANHGVMHFVKFLGLPRLASTQSVVSELAAWS
jgi:hypothetical protein